MHYHLYLMQKIKLKKYIWIFKAETDRQTDKETEHFEGGGSHTVAICYCWFVSIIAILWAPIDIGSMVKALT